MDPTFGHVTITMCGIRPLGAQATRNGYEDVRSTTADLILQSGPVIKRAFDTIVEPTKGPARRARGGRSWSACGSDRAATARICRLVGQS
jgi:hypothetical protein